MLPDVRSDWSISLSDPEIKSDAFRESGPLDDLPRANDLDGDGAAEPAVCRQGVCWILRC